jgi:hypothetical protein
MHFIVVSVCCIGYYTFRIAVLTVLYSITLLLSTLSKLAAISNLAWGKCYWLRKVKQVLWKHWKFSARHQTSYFYVHLFSTQMSPIQISRIWFQNLWNVNNCGINLFFQQFDGVRIVQELAFGGLFQKKIYIVNFGELL